MTGWSWHGKKKESRGARGLERVEWETWGLRGNNHSGSRAYTQQKYIFYFIVEGWKTAVEWPKHAYRFPTINFCMYLLKPSATGPSDPINCAEGYSPFSASVSFDSWLSDFAIDPIPPLNYYFKFCLPFLFYLHFFCSFLGSNEAPKKKKNNWACKVFHPDVVATPIS